MYEIVESNHAKYLIKIIKRCKANDISIKRIFKPSRFKSQKFNIK